MTQNPEPRTQNPEPGTRNPEPGTQNPEPGTQNPEPRTFLVREEGPRIQHKYSVPLQKQRAAKK